MNFGKRAFYLAVHAFGVLSISSGAKAESTSRLPSLDDYPTPVVEHVVAEFDIQRQALESGGIPENVDELAVWNVCANSEENAHRTYVDAFSAKVLSERLRLLADAGKLPCYHYPFESGLLSRLFGSSVDVTSGTREAARLLASEISVQLALGEIDRAVQHAESGVELIGQFAKAPTNLVQLSRYACVDIILGSIQDLLSCAILTEAQLVRLDQALTRAYDPATLARTWIAEKITYEQTDPFEACSTIYLHDARSRAQLLAARSAVAIERYRKAKSELPGTLADLVPAYLPEVPLDPFDGESLRLVVSEKTYAVFSVDDDGIACPNPLEVVQSDERSMIRVLVEKISRLLSELYYEHSSGQEGLGGADEKKSIELVSNQMAAGPKQSEFQASVVKYTAGPIDGGMGIMLDSVRTLEGPLKWKPILAAFWVSGDTIYTVNTWARDLVPHLPQAPETITFDRVRDVVR